MMYNLFSQFTPSTVIARSETTEQSIIQDAIHHYWIASHTLAMTLIFLFISAPAHAGTAVPFTINLSETVNVTGTPRVAVDVGGVTRYADYSSGTGTNALTFTYNMQAGDVDLDGVTLSSPIDLNGGTISDTAGNPISDLTFTPPNTSNVKVNYPSLGMDFVKDSDGRYTLNGTVYEDLPSFLTATGGTFTRNSIGTYFDENGVMQTASANQPRFDHDPVTHAPKGILIEESRTNLLTRSSEFDDAAWIKSNTIVSTGVSSPSNSLTAYLVNEGSSFGEHYINNQNVTITSGTKYVLSCYIKAGSNGFAQITIPNSSVLFGSDLFINIDLNNGIITNSGGAILFSGVQSVGNGWVRAWLSGNATSSSGLLGGGVIAIIPNANSSRLPAYTGSSKTIYVWGAQLEQGSFPTSYIPTTTAAVTRQTDVLNIPTNAWFNGSEGVYFSAWNKYGGDASRIIGFNNAVDTPLTHTATGSLQAYNLTTSGSVNTSGGIVSLNSISKGASSYSPTTGMTLSGNGSAVANNASFSLPTPSTIRIAPSVGGPNGYFGTIQKFKYYPAHIPNTQLQLMTQ